MIVAQDMSVEWRLRNLLAGQVAVADADDRPVSGLCADTRQLVPGAVFFARSGAKVSAADTVPAAIAGGAAAIVCEAGVGVPGANGPVPVYPLADISGCMGAVADRFFGAPSSVLKCIGVTGTNGKTSVSHFLAQALAAGGQRGGSRCGVIGTLGYGLVGELAPASHTTPEVLTVHRLLDEFRVAGADHAVLEVSSHALDQDRVAGVRFDTAVFTNLSRDHLDYHGEMDAYGAAKRRLFLSPGLTRAVVNGADKFGHALLTDIPIGVEVLTYGLDVDATRCQVQGRVRDAGVDGFTLLVESPWGSGEARVPLLGRFNAGNLLAALSSLLLLGIPLSEALQRLDGLRPVAGRMERFGGCGGIPLVVVDYAHTPDALEVALEAAGEVARGRVWCVLGCGGERDKGKRPMMGATAAARADHIVLTDDNPRGEDGERIIHEIRAGVPATSSVEVLRDRAAAICRAVSGAGPGDVVLVAGKGHESFQDTAGVRIPFSDAAVVRAALRERGS
jgi:UDP-N-acetylmuramoyl-L-alanyl-D-glutamate--2,6-diaminopimelate ligase